MARFIWYIVDKEDGSVEGTNNTDWLIESNIKDNDRFVLIHKDSGVYYSGGGEEQEVFEIPDGIEEEDE